VVAGVQHPPPEHPNPLPPQAAEEGPALQPPGGGALPNAVQVLEEFSPADADLQWAKEVLNARSST
jgi:hypothetical protein